jgi:hypothetical protein
MEKIEMQEQGAKYPEVLTVFLCFILALLGGTAKELSKSEEAFTWRNFLKNIFVSGFCGIIVGLFAPDFDHKNWIMVCAGISGVAGIQFLDFCTEILKTVIKKTIDAETKKE